LPLEQLAKQTLGGPRVAPALHQDVQHHPVLVHGRHNQCFTPAIVSTTSSRCHLSPAAGSLRRTWFANACPNFSAHWRTVSWLTMMPRAASSSSTMRRLRGKRKYSQTAWLMTSAGKR